MGGSSSKKATVEDTKLEQTEINNTITNIFSTEVNTNKAGCVAYASNILAAGDDMILADGCEVTLSANASCVSVVEVQNDTESISELQNAFSEGISDQLINNDPTDDGFYFPDPKRSYSDTDIKDTVINTIQNRVTMQTVNQVIAEANAGATNKIDIGGSLICSGGTLNMDAEAVASVHIDEIGALAKDAMYSDDQLGDYLRKYEDRAEMANTGITNSLIIFIGLIAIGSLIALSLLGAFGKKDKKSFMRIFEELLKG